MTFRDTIRTALREQFSVLSELFYMKNFNITQAHVLQAVMPLLGNFSGLNEFLASPIGLRTMKAYRELLIQKFGDEAGNNKPNTDEQAHPGFNSLNKEAHDALVRDLSTELVNKVRG